MYRDDALRQSTGVSANPVTPPRLHTMPDAAVDLRQPIINRCRRSLRASRSRSFPLAVSPEQIDSRSESFPRRVARTDLRFESIALVGGNSLQRTSANVTGRDVKIPRLADLETRARLDARLCRRRAFSRVYSRESAINSVCLCVQNAAVRHCLVEIAQTFDYDFRSTQRHI